MKLLITQILTRVAGIAGILSAVALVVWADNHDFHFPDISTHIDSFMELFASSK